jgi:hypothetical protein
MASSSTGYNLDHLNDTRDSYGSVVRFQRPALTMRDSTGSSIVSNEASGQDRHDVVRLPLFILDALVSSLTNTSRW